MQGSGNNLPVNMSFGSLHLDQASTVIAHQIIPLSWILVLFIQLSRSSSSLEYVIYFSLVGTLIFITYLRQT